MATPTPPEDEAGDTETEPNRKRAALAVLPFLLLGVADVLLILGMGLRPLWGFALLPPILFVSALAWIAFKTGFVGHGAGGQV